eukprot:TRINITY_DN7197_c0_g1_i1.p1 TRINITY_DN7197_c0_g1~~TRINITY_DN7197_c0_g1_i1.p1  ORF type:complete len:109 (-),score=22.29 TRINITY_DN7197_c0_g1_i1:32-325(-)
MAAEYGLDLDVLYQTIKVGVNAIHLDIQDLTDGCSCGAKVHVVVVSEDFEGKSLLQQQRAVNHSIGEALMSNIHAITMKTFTPEKYSSFLEQNIANE